MGVENCRKSAENRPKIGPEIDPEKGAQIGPPKVPL